MLKIKEDKIQELNYKNKITDLEQENQQLKQQLEEKEKQIEHWHNLYKKRDQQFQSVRQRYHLLNKLQSNYDKKDKLHLLEMQCFELVKENEELKQQLKTQPAEIVEKIKKQIFNHFNVKNMEEYENLSLIDSLFTADAAIEMLDTILKEYQT